MAFMINKKVNIFGKTQKLCFVCHNIGEDEWGYLFRVEGLSRDADLAPEEKPKVTFHLCYQQIA